MKKTITSLLCLTATSLACATTPAWNEHKGNYAELVGGTNAYYLGILSSRGSVGGAGVTGAGWAGALGYNFTNTFGLEAGLMQNFVDLNGGGYVISPYTTTRFTLPIGQRFSFIGKLGLMAPFVPEEGGIVLPYTGVGFSYAATKNLDFTLQYQGAFYVIAGAGLLGAGITYHFDM